MGTTPLLSNAGLVGDSAADTLAWGLAFLHPSINYSLQYGDGLPSAPGRQVKAAVHQLSPSIRIRLGERWNFSYTPSFTWYSNDELDNNVQHAASLRGGYVLENWQIGLAQSFSASSEPLIETGGQTRQENWGTSLSLSTPLNSRTSLSFGLSQELRFTSRFTDVKTWSGTTSLNYQYTPEIKTGVSVGGGYSSIEPGADQSFQHIKGSLDWSVGGRLALQIEGGLDVRRTSGSNRDALINPIMGASASYRLFEATTASVGVDRTVAPSYFSDQVTESMSYTFGLTQRLLGRFSLSLNASQNETDYVATDTLDPAVERNDSLWTYSAALSTRLLKRLSVSVSWQQTENQSDAPGYALTSTTYGLNLGWQF